MEKTLAVLRQESHIHRQTIGSVLMGKESESRMKREYIVAIDCIGEIPPDNKEIIRCKDCMHMRHLEWLDDETGKAIVCDKHVYAGLRNEEFFCADGERR